MANPKPTPLSFNIAARLIGDMRQDDALDQFLHSLERVKTDDCTESILVNAVKDMLHDPKPPGFAFNRISSPEGSFVRVDATIWIGMPEAPMGVSTFQICSNPYLTCFGNTPFFSSHFCG